MDLLELELFPDGGRQIVIRDQLVSFIPQSECGERLAGLEAESQELNGFVGRDRRVNATLQTAVCYVADCQWTRVEVMRSSPSIRRRALVDHDVARQNG